MAAEPLLDVRGLVKRFGGLVATDGVDLAIAPGEIHAVIGPNGAGKTTLIAQLMGELQPDQGSIRFAGTELIGMSAASRARLGLARSFQITQIFKRFTALENVMLAVLATQPAALGAWRPARSDPRLHEPAREFLAVVGLAARAGVAAAALAHGEQRQLEIAMALATRPQLLLLDEPMAGMGKEESERMTALLRGLKGRETILLVEHDMDVVFALADRITVLVYGRAVASGTPAEIRRDPQVRAAYLGEDDAA
ncbi:MAG: ABC transporter ATP-binding protein [Alphaproteobacteria bacterium]|nr:ABC transporter ATP-binding protein [Alphaproteobacteria bacterium]